MKPNHAVPEQLKEIMKIFRKYKEWFPHIRDDKIGNLIKEGLVVYEDNCAITYGIYKRKISLGNVMIPKGAAILHQIVVGEQGKKIAEKVLERFVLYINRDIYLTVREDNMRARNFYHKNGFDQVGSITWKQGTIAGLIYLRKATCNPIDLFADNQEPTPM